MIIFQVQIEIKSIEPEEETEPNCQKVSKSCEEFDHKYCKNFNAYYMGEEFDFKYTRDFKRCIPKADNTNCEIKKCSELSINDCNRFNIFPSFDDTQQCIAKKDNSGCEIKTCEEMPIDECGLITNKNFFWKCEKENDKCIEKFKECSEMPLLYCEIANGFGNNCHLNKSKNKCLSENEEKEKNDPNKSNEKKFIKLYLFSIILNLLNY